MSFNLEVESLDGGFVNLDKKAKSIIPIIRNYKFTDLVIAIFAITSWRDNRSAQENCLAFNSALIQCNHFGSEEIVSYLDFTNFFNKIKHILQVTSLDDEVVNDFGEIHLCFGGQFYPIITGTGHTASVYATLQCLENLSSELGCHTDTQKVLEYSKTMINSLKTENLSRYTSPKIVFEIPTEKYFNLVQAYFETNPVALLPENVITSFTSTLPMVKTHFINKNGEIFPLFNPSLVLDYYIKLLNNATPVNIRNHIHMTLSQRIGTIHLNSSEKINDILLYMPKVAADKNIVPIKEPAFLYSHGNIMALFIDVDGIKHEEIESYINQIRQIQAQGKLGFVDLGAPVAEKQYLGISVSPKQRLDVILFNHYTNIEEAYFQLGARNERTVFIAIDLIFMLSISNDVEEILNFLEYRKQEQAQVFSWGGLSDMFSLWKQEQGYISKGAQAYHMISTAAETAAAYVFELYATWQKCFPFNLEFPHMGIPEQWEITFDENNVYQFAKKNIDPQGGAGFLLDNNCFLFFSYDFFSIMENKNTQDVRMWRDLVSGLNERFILEHMSQFGRIEWLNNRYVNVQCKSLDTIHEVGKYVRVVDYHEEPGAIELYYTVDCRRLVDDISASKDRAVESEYLLQLLAPLFRREPNDEFREIKYSIAKASSGNKTVNTALQNLDYYINMDFLSIRLKDEALIAARKTIAQIAAENDINPGKYKRKDATKVVRKMQESLVGYLETKVLNFDRLTLHTKLLHYCATELMGSYINQHSYFLTDEVDVAMQQENKNKLISARKENKEIQLSLQYLIETNLFLVEERGESSPKNADIENLVAFTHWLGILQSHSDMCFHTTADTNFIILDDYRVNVELGDEYQALIKEMEKRTYESDIYAVQGDDNDKDYFDEVSKGFLKDTGIDFRVLEVVLRQLMECSFPEQTVSFSELKPNVIRVNKFDAVKDVQAFVSENISLDMVQKAYDFITLLPNNLKTIENTQHNTLPIWEREKRDNRFDVKPLLLVGDSYIYSPVTIKELHSRWVNGWMQFYPPYEIGLKNSLAALWKWKEYYEHLFSTDICNMFREKGCIFAESDVDIRRKDRLGNHPSIDILGDYDVVALDMLKKKVFIIECKVLQPVGSVFEHSMQQKRFFSEDKYDEKFQKRIDYFANHYEDFFRNLGYEIDGQEYIFEPYMVVNKVFASYYKEVKFPIITFDELLKQI